MDEAPERDGGVDPWAAHLPGQELVPAYLTSPYAARYRVIVDVLLAGQDTSLTGLSYDQVAAGVRERLTARLPDETADAPLDPQVLHLDARLERLTQWRVLIRWQEPARTGEDFLWVAGDEPIRFLGSSNMTGQEPAVALVAAPA